MSEYRDRVVEEVTDKVVQRQSTPDDEALIREKAGVAVDKLIDEPVQTFTPLLAENEVVTDLLGNDRGQSSEDSDEPA